MRRAIARGRVFPQSYSTDRRYGRLSLKACALFPLMWANADDQGRLCGDPDEIKYSCCPNIDHITKADIPELLTELAENKLTALYDTPKSSVIQILDWWDIQRPQWAWPSTYPPPDGWQDRLRYKKSAKEVATYNWPSQVSAQVSEDNSSGECSGEQTKQLEEHTPPHPETETERGKGKRKEERGNSPEPSGEKPPLPNEITTKDIPRSRTEAEETLCEGGRGVISVWCSVKGFNMILADASALVTSLRTEFTDVDILEESKAWAARKLSEPLTSRSKPASQIWNWMRLAKKFQERRRGEQAKSQRVKGSRPASDFRSRKW